MCLSLLPSTRDSFSRTCSLQHVRILFRGRRPLDIAKSLIHSSSRRLPDIRHTESEPLLRYNQSDFLTSLQENLKVWFGWLLKRTRRNAPIRLAPIAFKPAAATSFAQSATQSTSINSFEPISDKHIPFAPIVMVHEEEV